MNATDSASHTASSALSIKVLGPTGAACNDISWDIGGTMNPIIPINDLGTGNYFGTEGGLYGGGSNTPPAQHEADGLTFASEVTPLDATGNPSSSGKIGMLGIGISTLLYEMIAFGPMAQNDLSVNPNLVIVNGGEATADATDFASLSSPFWATLINNIVPNSGLTTKQVEVVIFEDVDASPTGTYPSDNVQLQNELETIAQNVLIQFPNVKLMYYVSRMYSGYSGTFDLSDPEPYCMSRGSQIRALSSRRSTELHH